MDPEMKKLVKENFPSYAGGENTDEVEVEAKAKEGGDEIGMKIMEEAKKLDEMNSEKGGEKGGGDTARIERLIKQFGDPTALSPSDARLIGPETVAEMVKRWKAMSDEEKKACCGDDMPGAAMGAAKMETKEE